MKQMHKILTAFLFVLAACQFPSSTLMAQQQEPNVTISTDDTYRQLNLFGAVFERVRAEYVEEPNDEKLVQDALNGMLSALDPHSAYMSKKDFEDMQVQTKGEFGGLGIEVTMENGVVKVISPIDDTPAFKAGVRTNDLIIAVDKEPIPGMTLTQAVEKMRGPPGTKVKLTMRRGEKGEPFELTLKRAVIKIKPVRYRIEGSDIGYIRVTTFNEQTQEELDKALAAVKRKLGNKLEGYVLDLRNNPGGLFDQAISVSDTFLDGGEIVSTRGRSNKMDFLADKPKPGASEKELKILTYSAKKGDAINGKPLVVLINGGSASAAEIVAGALQDHHRAIVMGTRTFGKGSVQTVIPMPPYGAIRLTTARYYTPAGRSIQATGIVPDINVAPAKIQAMSQDGYIREADLKGALPNENGETAPPREEAVEKPDEAASVITIPPLKSKKQRTAAELEAEAAAADYQLARALDLLHGVKLFETKVQ